MPDRSAEEGLEEPISDEERRAAALAHLCALFSVLPLLGLFPTVGIYNRRKQTSPWVARQAVQAALFQVLTFNVILVVMGIVVPITLVGWATRYEDGNLVLAVVLTALPFLLVHYAVQAVLVVRAASAIRTGADYRYPWVGGLIGPAKD